MRRRSTAAASVGEEGEGGSDDEEQGGSLKANTKRVWSMHNFSLDWPYLFLGTIGALVVGGANPAVGIVFVKAIALFYEDTGSEMMDEAIKWNAIMIGISLSQTLGDTCRYYGFSVPGQRLTKKLREMLFTSITRQEIGWHDMPENSPGKLSACLGEDITLMQALAGETMGRNILVMFTAVFAFTFTFVFGHWKVALVTMATIPFLVGGFALELSLIAGSAATDNMGSEAGKLVGETTSSVRTVAAFGMEDAFMDKFGAIVADNVARMNRLAYIKGSAVGISQISLFFSFGLMYWYGGKMVNEGETDLEGMTVPIFCIFMLAVGLGMAGQNVTDAAKASSTADRVFDTIDRKSAIDWCADDGQKPSTVRGDITFKDVVFRYPSRPDQVICRKYNLEVEAGTTVALVGQSGSGKSTAVSLFQRFYDPEKGTVSLDGTDITQLNVSWLREQIGVVSQEPVLFMGTIADNIRYGKPDATHEEIVEAAKMANAHEFISEFPEQYDTTVGDKGGQLSGGQKQRVAIARAIIKNPPILLLDEATSALDNESERIVQEALDNLLAKQKRTTLVIAHRLSTIRNADKIVVIEKGEVVEQGSHDELMAIGEGGKYHTLHELANT